eukprot:3541966-Amphidinium_carterae.1
MQVTQTLHPDSTAQRSLQQQCPICREVRVDCTCGLQRCLKSYALLMMPPTYDAPHNLERPNQERENVGKRK